MVLSEVLMDKKFTFHEDPGHGWLKVSKSFYLKLGLTPTCSYDAGSYVYLEEDLDAPAFLNKLEELNITYLITRKWTNRRSRIRTNKPFTTKEVVNE